MLQGLHIPARLQAGTSLNIMQLTLRTLLISLSLALVACWEQDGNPASSKSVNGPHSHLKIYLLRVRRKPRIFYISSSTTTSTVTTSTVCYVSSTAAPVACSKRRKRWMVLEPDQDVNFDEDAVSVARKER